MAWRWRYQRSDGAIAVAPDAGEPPSFSSQSDAESWIGEEWQMLLEDRRRRGDPDGGRPRGVRPDVAAPASGVTPHGHV